MLPENIGKFFWEYKGIEIDEKENWFFVIERLLEYGDIESIRWMLTNYDQKQLTEVVKTSRKISKKTASIWQNYYDLPKEEISCMNTLCQKTDMTFLAN